MKYKWKKLFIQLYFSGLSLTLVIMGCLLLIPSFECKEMFTNNQLTGLFILIFTSTMLFPFWEKALKELKKDD